MRYVFIPSPVNINIVLNGLFHKSSRDKCIPCDRSVRIQYQYEITKKIQEIIEKFRYPRQMWQKILVCWALHATSRVYHRWVYPSTRS